MKVANQVASKRLDSELVALFGRSVVDHSQRVSFEDLVPHVDGVTEAADLLLRKLKGQPAKQRAVIEGMDGDAALALCKWIREPATGQRLREMANLELQNRPD